MITKLTGAAQFEEECFRFWLTRIEAQIGATNRNAYGSIANWRMSFDEGMSEAEAIRMRNIPGQEY